MPTTTVQDLLKQVLSTDGLSLNVTTTGSGTSISSSGFSTATPTYPKQSTVTTSSTTLLAANALRMYAHFMNNTSSTVYLQWGAAAVVGQGIPLKPGALYTISGFDLWKGSIAAISGSGSVSIDVMEATI